MLVIKSMEFWKEKLEVKSTKEMEKREWCRMRKTHLKLFSVLKEKWWGVNAPRYRPFIQRDW